MINQRVVEQISETERIISSEKPNKEVVFVHQFQTEGKWKTCLNCGDKLPGRKPTPGPVKNIEHIKNCCSKYRSSINL